MKQHTDDSESGGLDIHEILFALYRHKGKALLFTFLGLSAALAYYFLSPRYFQSRSQLLVKYVLERNAVGEAESQIDTSGRYNDNLMATEAVILRSWDLAREVAEAFGPDRLLADAPGEHTAAEGALVIGAGLEVTVGKGSGVLSIAFNSEKPELPQAVLTEFLKHYFDKHLEVHRSKQAADFVLQQQDRVKARVNTLDDDIKALKQEAGITSLASTTGDIRLQIAERRGQLMTAEAERDERKARLDFFAKSLKTDTAQEVERSRLAAPPPFAIQEYRDLNEKIAFYKGHERQLLLKKTVESTDAKRSRANIQQLEESRTRLETEFPALTAARSPGGDAPIDAFTEQARLIATLAKIETLKTQLNELHDAAGKVDAVSTTLRDLESQREMEQKTYVDYKTKLDTLRIDETLDRSKIPNITILQTPTPVAPALGKRSKIVAGLAAGGAGIGIALALALGLVLDRSVKRPVELGDRFGIPLMFTIPKLTGCSRKRLNGRAAINGKRLTVGAAAHERGTITPWEDSHPIRPSAEVIRDRLILSFELKKLTHKPKLVAIAGVAGGEGSSTIAAGLAASLSETGDGKVLLVDMSGGNPEMRQFLEGRTGRSLAEIIQPGAPAPVAGNNLFLATGEATGGENGTTSPGPKRFYDLMPVLRTSDFDYIIFDMPPVDHSGATLAVSGFMDKMLLVVEAEKTERGALSRVYSELVAAQADVAAVLNKVDARVPAWVRGA